MASGYGSRTLTQSAAHTLFSSKENASALSLSNEKRYVQAEGNDLRELSEAKVGVPTTSENVGNTISGVLRDNSGPTRGSYAVRCGTKILHFTGSNLHLEEEGVLQRPKAFKRMPQTTSFTLV